MAKQSLEHLRVPPHSLEAEMSLLGSIMLDKDAIIKVADLVRPGDFYKEDHNFIYETILELYEKREPIDVLSLSNRIDEKKRLDDRRLSADERFALSDQILSVVADDHGFDTSAGVASAWLERAKVEWLDDDGGEEST